jgi:hypothetical protein
VRHVIALLVASVSITFQAAAFQGGAGAGQTAIRACSLLTRDLVAPFEENKKLLDLIPPQEEPMGSSGSACEYGSVRLQLRSGVVKPTMSAKDQTISGVGDGGFFHNNRDYYAELVVWTAKHTIMLQVGVPTGKTAESIKADTVKLASAIVAKLR